MPHFLNFLHFPYFPPQSPLSRGLTRLALLVGLLALANLACITINQTVIFDQDGSGNGVVKLEMKSPRDLADKTAGDTKELTASLAQQGWENIKVVPIEPAHYLATAEYHFSEEKPLKTILPTFTLKVEEAENGYKYYTFEGEADYSQLADFWNQAENDWAKNGIEMDLDLFGLGSSGKAKISAEEVQAMLKTYGPPSASLTIILPGQTPVEANQFWDNEDEFMAGKTDFVTFSWAPDKRAKAPLKVQRRLEPLTTVTQSEAAAQILKLLEIYVTVIPKGATPVAGPLSGPLNNRTAAFIDGGNYLCSAYQARILHWLDTIRASPDESTRNLLKGLDYGPIQTSGGGHRAVVLFQRGTDWKKTGIVLDPWPRQEPDAFEIGEWSSNVWTFFIAAQSPEPDAEAGALYPHLSGKTSSYPASPLWQGDLGRGLAKPTRLLMVHSPVSALITLADGRRLGVSPDGAFVNELPGEAYIYTFPKSDATGESEWLLFLPETAFTVELAGTGAGDFHVVLATPQGYVGFGPQPIQSGQRAAFSAEASGQLSALTLPDGSTVQPQTIADDQLDAALGIQPAATPTPTTPPFTQVAGLPTDSPPSTSQAAGSQPAGMNNWLASPILWGSLICAGVLGLLALGAALVAVNWSKAQRPPPISAPAGYQPARPGGAWLLIRGPEGQRQYPLPKAHISLGRTPDNDLPLPGVTVSRRHATIDFEKGRYVLRDLGSANGVRVNGRRISGAVYLAAGDAIQIEDYTLMFRVD